MVLDGVSGIVRPRSLTAMLGPSGAGKTTLLNTLVRGWCTGGGVCL